MTSNIRHLTTERVKFTSKDSKSTSSPFEPKQLSYSQTARGVEQNTAAARLFETGKKSPDLRDRRVFLRLELCRTRVMGL